MGVWYGDLALCIPLTLSAGDLDRHRSGDLDCDDDEGDLEPEEEKGDLEPEEEEGDLDLPEWGEVLSKDLDRFSLNLEPEAPLNGPPLFFDALPESIVQVRVKEHCKTLNKIQNCKYLCCRPTTRKGMAGDTWHVRILSLRIGTCDVISPKAN